MDQDVEKDIAAARKIQRMSVVDWEHEFTRSILILLEKGKEISFRQKIVWNKLKKKYNV